MIKGRKRLVKFYTGCPTAEIFMFIVDHVRPKHKKLQYYRGSSSTTTTPKKHQISPVTQLEPLIYWPTAEETLSYTHPHFAGNFHKCEGIGDCTE